MARLMSSSKTVTTDLLLLLTLVTHLCRIGSGTGIFTRALFAHPDWSSSIGTYRAVEPSAGMRSQFQHSVSDERIQLSEGTFDATGASDGQADLIFIAQVSISSWVDSCATKWFLLVLPGLSLVP